MMVVMGLMRAGSVEAQEAWEVLILEDIGNYRLPRTSVDIFTGEISPITQPYRVARGSGILGPTGHFEDHEDKTYSTYYINDAHDYTVTVQVTLHAGSEWDRRWLLHEVEDAYRSSKRLNEALIDGAILRII